MYSCGLPLAVINAQIKQASLPLLNGSIMPYKSEKIKLPVKYDRRIKLLPEDKKEIKELYKNNISIREITRRFNVSRRLIQFTLFPKRIEKARLNRDWRDYYNKEKHKNSIKEHRRYKQELYLANKI